MKLKEGAINKTYITQDYDTDFKIRLAGKDNISGIYFYHLWRSKHRKQLHKITTIKNNKITNSRWS